MKVMHLKQTQLLFKARRLVLATHIKNIPFTSHIQIILLAGLSYCKKVVSVCWAKLCTWCRDTALSCAGYKHYMTWLLTDWPFPVCYSLSWTLDVSKCCNKEKGHPSQILKLKPHLTVKLQYVTELKWHRAIVMSWGKPVTHLVHLKSMLLWRTSLPCLVSV